jgi:hypothetical protein
MHFGLLVLLAAPLLLLPGCVELTGQRITWFYDTAKDELLILIHYDGIHNADTRGPNGTEQIPEFVKHGDVMILDWPFYTEMADLRAQARNENSNPRHREWARLIVSIETRPVGYYREPNGRVGAAQLLTIPKAKDFVRRFNGLINEEILAEMDPETISRDDEMARTLRRMHAAAGKGHQWIALDGQAVRFAIPVHPGEWARLKAQTLDELAGEVAEALGPGKTPEERMNVAFALRALTSAPISYVDEGDRVTFVLGRQKTPSTFRLQIRNEYEPSLEEVVAETVKTNLDEELAAALLDETAEPSPPVSRILTWCPPEEQVRALVRAARRGGAVQKSAALERLSSWAVDWNRDRGVPAAPKHVDDRQKYLAAWESWYAQMRQFPLFANGDEAGNPAGVKP